MQIPKTHRVASQLVVVAVTAILLFSSMPSIQNTVLTAQAQTNSYQISSTWLQQQISQWQSAKSYRLNFSVQFTSASYSNLNSLDLAALQANLNMLYSTGASFVRMDISYDPWLNNNQTRISMIDSLASNIKSHDKILVIADGAANAYRITPELWTQFKADWVTRVQSIAARYHPDYYIVIKEPGWYVPMVADAQINPQFQNASDWLALTQQLVSTVKQVSPNTQIGVSVAASDMSQQSQFYDTFLNGAENMQGISFVGFDIYDIPGFTNTQKFLSQYGNNNRSVWIAEAWSGVGNISFDPSRSSLDVLWMQGLYYYALYIHAQLINPYFTNIFSSYNQAPKDSQDLISFYQNKTSVYGEFSTLVAQNQGGSPTSFTQTTSSTPYSISTIQTSSTSQTKSRENTSLGRLDTTAVIAGVAIAVIALGTIAMAVRRRRKI